MQVIKIVTLQILSAAVTVLCLVAEMVYLILRKNVTMVIGWLEMVAIDSVWKRPSLLNLLLHRLHNFHSSRSFQRISLFRTSCRLPRCNNHRAKDRTEIPVRLR